MVVDSQTDWPTVIPMGRDIIVSHMVAKFTELALQMGCDQIMAHSLLLKEFQTLA